MRRLATAAFAAIAAALALALAAGASSTQRSPYEVRAIFDDAAFAVIGEDVRVAGANVGSVKALDVTTQKQAAVTLEIDKGGFVPFHRDATCSIRPQSLIGEKYVDCSPGTASTPRLQLIKGAYLLPVTNTHSPVDTDIVQDISQQPTREQLSLIINELGTGLAARGSDLNAVIHRADPALGYTDRVFKILARQSQSLAQLATDADAILTPLAQERQAISGFITQARITSDAAATQSAGTSRTFAKLPAFLQQLKPLMAKLGQLATQATPTLQGLLKGAPGLGRATRELAPFAGAAGPALIKLGNAAQASQPALQDTLPLAQRLATLGAQTQPAAQSLDALTKSFDDTGGIEQLMSALLYGTTAANGFDATSHYVRLQVLVGSCTQFQPKTGVPGCSANFPKVPAAADGYKALLRYLTGR
jgi:ABC-type transporter Mla subunit MlaD